MGAVVKSRLYSMIIYPILAAEWDHLQRVKGGASQAGSARLGFYISSTLPDLLGPPAETIFNRPALLIDAEDTTLGIKKLFDGSNGKKLNRIAFLMFPSHLAAEMVVITKYLESLNVRVYCAGTTGAWERFIYPLLYTNDPRAGPGGGVILFHPSMSDYHKIPTFWHTLYQGMYNHFEVDANKNSTTGPSGPTDWTCKRLFPHRSIILITDDVFTHYPGKALEILEVLKRKNKVKPAGATFDRIWTRPELEEFLLQLASEQYEPESKAGNKDRIKLYRVASEMLQPESSGVTSPLAEDEARGSLIVSPAAWKTPQYQSLHDSSPQAANDWLVEYFAGHCLEMRTRFRMFTVIHQGSGKPDRTPRDGRDEDEKAWMGRFQHIVVMKPDKWLDISKKKTQHERNDG